MCVCVGLHVLFLVCAVCLRLLAQAVAKLRFDDTVIRSDVDAAIALMRASQASIEPELEKRTREDPVSRLYLVSTGHTALLQGRRVPPPLNLLQAGSGRVFFCALARGSALWLGLFVVDGQDTAGSGGVHASLSVDRVCALCGLLSPAEDQGLGSQDAQARGALQHHRGVRAPRRHHRGECCCVAAVAPNLPAHSATRG